MSGGLIALIAIFVVNTIIALTYLFICLFRLPERAHSTRIKGAIMLLIPIFGPIYIFLSWALFVLFFREPVDLEAVIFSKERVKTYMHAEEDRERNLASIEEAIEITDKGSLRALMMNVVRGDIQNSLSSIALALNSSDTETAHYAASVLQDALNDFRASVEKQKDNIYNCEDPDSRSIYCEMLIDYMNQVLEQGVFTDMEQRTYVRELDGIGDFFYETDREHMTSAQFEAITLRLLEIGDYDGCKKWCDRAEYHFPNTLATYTCQLKLYFNSGQKNRFFDVIEQLKHSQVVIDSETLELIRVFR